MEGMNKMEGTCPLGPIDYDIPFAYSGGSLRGHQLPGSFMLIWGVWQTINIIRHYFLSLKSKQNYMSVPWYGNISGFPIEPFFKIFFTVCGIALEIGVVHSYRALIGPNGLFINMNVYQHTCMYSSFMLSGIVDILGFILPIPPNSEKLMLATSFALESVLILFHLGTPELSTQAHFLMVFITVSTAGSILFEILFPEAILLSLIRGTLLIFQGVWWHVIGQMLYGGYRVWHPCYMGSTMMVSMCFGFAAIAVIVFLILLYGMEFLVLEGYDCYNDDSDNNGRRRGNNSSTTVNNNNNDSIVSQLVKTVTTGLSVNSSNGQKYSRVEMADDDVTDGDNNNHRSNNGIGKIVNNNNNNNNSFNSNSNNNNNNNNNHHHSVIVHDDDNDDTEDFDFDGIHNNSSNNSNNNKVSYKSTSDYERDEIRV